MFRNTRAALTGFPERRARLAPLDPCDDIDSAKVKWLAALLKELGAAKVLLICHTRELAEQTQERLLREVNVSTALFHEGMTLVQRDRAAVHFADEEGARILLCSEIGSEGRNFQFAHHLVLYDLPTNPELLEQRIGRLDRIGQTEAITIHVPYVRHTAGEMLARWYHEGLDAFEKLPHGALDILTRIGGDLGALCAEYDAAHLDALIRETRAAASQVAAQLAQGHDRLLQLTSFKADAAQRVIEAVHAVDDDLDFEDFIIRLMDRLGVVVEAHGHRSHVLRPGDLMTDALPALPPEGLFVTFDRIRALSRENIGFLTIDHPTVRGALDHLLGTELGNTAFGIWKNAGTEGILLDLHFVVDCIAPAALHVNRFLPALPLRIIVDHAQQDQTDNEAAQTAGLSKGDPSKLLDNAAFRKKLMPAMLKKARAVAAERLATIAAEAQATMTRQLDAEIERLETLAAVNRYVRSEEAEALRREKAQLTTAIAGATLRLDVLRLILQTQKK